MKLEIEIDNNTGYSSQNITVNIVDKGGSHLQILNIMPTQDLNSPPDLNLVSAAINFGKRKFMEMIKKEIDK